MERFTYRNEGTCSDSVAFEIEGDRIVKAEFSGGCPGNLEAVCRLVSGMDVNSVIERLRGIRCGDKDTSCPDQLAKALAKSRVDVKKSPEGVI